MTDHIGVILVEYDTKLSRPIKQCAIYDEYETKQQLDQLYRLFYIEYETELSRPIQQGTIHDEDQTGK